MKTGFSRKELLYSFLVGAVFGALVFLCLYGAKILDTGYEDWLLTGWYDLSQHYVGSVLYRFSGWHLPIGLCDKSFYPYLASVIYTDSIPLVSLIVKILSPLLPETFQFFGIYGLICFMLQGGVARILLMRILEKGWMRNISLVPFLFCAPLWQRMYYHTALASHFLILLAIGMFMYRDRIRTLRKRVLLWCLLGMLCISIHFTIYGMVSVMLAGFALWEYLDSKKIQVPLIYLASYIFSTACVFYIFGGFYGNVSGTSDGLGSYSANLNSLFNPIDYSVFIKELPLIENQYEGLSYIGIAALIFFPFALFNIIRRRRYLWAICRNGIIACGVTSGLLWFIALSPKVTLGDWEIINVKYPQFILDAWGIFRASGRFLWPVMYAVILLCIYFARYETKKFFSAFLIIVMILQICEFSEKRESIAEEYREDRTAYFSAYELDDEAVKGIKHIQFMHDYYFGEYYCDEIRDQMIGYALFAIEHGMDVSNFHFSRDDMDTLRERISECDMQLREGNPEPDTMYVFRYEDVDLGEMFDKYSGVEYIYTDTEIILISEKGRADNDS